MNVYVISRSRKGEPLDLLRAEPSLDAAKYWVNRQYHIELYRVDQAKGIWKATWNQVDEVYVHRIELTVGAA